MATLTLNRKPKPVELAEGQALSESITKCIQIMRQRALTQLNGASA